MSESGATANPNPAPRVLRSWRFSFAPKTLRKLGSFRRRFGWLFVFLPLVYVIVADLRIRGSRIVAMPPKYLGVYAVAMVESLALWSALIVVASARRGASRWIGAAFLVFLLTLSLGVQRYFHEQYAIYLNLDATLFGTNVMTSAVGQVFADGSHFLSAMLPPFVFGIFAVWWGRRAVRPKRRTLWVARLLAPIFVVAVFFIPCSYQRLQASTPDVIYFHAMGGLFKALAGERNQSQVRPGERHPPPMPKLVPKQPMQRNVVFILTESVRYDAHCSAPTEQCQTTPFTNAAAPNRMPFEQLRSNTSTTAIELAVLWSGLEPIRTREELHTAPLIYDYAHAAGMDNAYWTSHHMMFANSRLFVQGLPTTFQTGASDLDPVADIDLGAWDDLLMKRVEEQMPRMKEPFMGVVHLCNTHVPYRVDPNDAPFQPMAPSKDPDQNEPYHNYYRNAVYMQDKALAEIVTWIRAQPFGDRTIIVFTSDHGEAFREHGQLCHTGSILDEEIHVPGWIDAPPGTLTDEERAQILARRSKPLWHTDITPTILDMMGLWDAPELAQFKKSMVGDSMLRPPSEGRDNLALAMTNCSGIWGCAFKSWGMMRGLTKLEARENDETWHCFDLASDPFEKQDLGPEKCGDLVDLANRAHGGFPGDK
ncbi:MAG: sulfatase-like hydrolase/transferase [Polyangiaceae bacterium]